MLKQTYTVAHKTVQSPNKFMHRVQYCSLQKKNRVPTQKFQGPEPKVFEL